MLFEEDDDVQAWDWRMACSRPDTWWRKRRFMRQYMAGLTALWAWPRHRVKGRASSVPGDSPRSTHSEAML